ncbi:unnamed protein product [Caretta caretta]
MEVLEWTLQTTGQSSHALRSLLACTDAATIDVKGIENHVYGDKIEPFMLCTHHIAWDFTILTLLKLGTCATYCTSISGYHHIQS